MSGRRPCPSSVADDPESENVSDGRPDVAGHQRSQPGMDLLFLLGEGSKRVDGEQQLAGFLWRHVKYLDLYLHQDLAHKRITGFSQPVSTILGKFFARLNRQARKVGKAR